MPALPNIKPSSRPSANAGSWQLADVIDFEYLLERDRERPLAELEARDQKIVGQLETPEEGITNDRRRVFRGWLELRRKDGQTSPLPGKVAIASWRVLFKLVAAVALALGALTAFNLLSYDGAQPINVATYLGWLVLVQIALVLIAFAVMLLRRLGWLSTETSLLTGLMRWGWTSLAARLNRHLFNHIAAKKRVAIESFWGSSAAGHQLYGRVAIWPLVGALQWFGVCFNVAAIATTVALVVFSDRAFGWQSAVNFSPEQIHQLTQTLATPWSAAAPAAAAPALEQIAGSKIVLKDGIRQLATENLVAWWPFLVAAVTVYGLLPRLALWFLTLVLGRRALGQLQFNHVACDRLFERLTPGTLQTQATGAEAARTDLQGAGSAAGTTSSVDRDDSGQGNDAIILISPELRQQLDETRLAALLTSRLQLRPVGWLEWSESTAMLQAVLEKLKAGISPKGTSRVVWLEEAWQPPIAEKLGGLRALRQVLGANGRLIVTLVGRPNGAEVLTAAKPADLKVWQDRLQTLGDPHLRVEALIIQPQMDADERR